jgi:hypothetical protein
MMYVSVGGGGDNGRADVHVECIGNGEAKANPRTGNEGPGVE